ncbi:MAG: hypothetical protein HLX50_02765 [Alteromonadaceae bacterium]|nr:hypothetical protein [Alteromonadaceae bacterium]
MLAENLENWAKKERLEGRTEARQELMRETAQRLIAMNLLTDAQIAEASGLSEAEVKVLRSEARH